MKTALFTFVLAIAGAITLAYLTAAVYAIVKHSRLGGCGWALLTWVAVLAVWSLLAAAGQIGGVSIAGPW